MKIKSGRTADQRNQAFTLIELLTVIAIIGILASIIIPTVSSVKASSSKAKTKVQFSEWGAGLELFKQEYGYYPSLTGASTAPTTDSGVNLGLDSTTTTRFAELMLGKKVTGADLDSSTASTAGTPLNQNKRRLSFYSFSNSELVISGTTASSLSDAFGNTDIYVIMDYNNDGLISSGTPTQDVRAGNATDGFTAVTGNKPTIPDTGIRAGVVFYSAGRGTGVSDTVTSW